jgi:isoquinoline 1-oxidoreductase beta subunit
MRNVSDTLADRRTILSGGGFLLGFLVLGRPGRALAASIPELANAPRPIADVHPNFAPNAFIRIDRTGPIRVVIPNVEMGQGVYTAEAMLLAEELDIGLDQLVVEHAPPDGALYATRLLHEQVTGGSTSIRSFWQVLREAGAVTRMMLIRAAATQWSVDPMACAVSRAVVSHAPSGRSATYGELAEDAARLPVPTNVPLKDPKLYQLIGKPMRRLDTPQKVDGATVFGIDVRIPGMMIATAVTCPSPGGQVASVDDRKARQVPGVKDIVQFPGGVAVIGQHFWAAKSGLDALDITWEAGPNARFSTESLFSAMRKTSHFGKALIGRELGNVNQAGKAIEAIYQLPMLAHTPMEPPNAVVHVRPDACEIWVGTQVPTRVVTTATRVTGLSEHQIILHSHYLGGGFGRRLETDSIDQAVRIAKQVPYPVKLIWTREDDIHHDIPRPAYYDRISAMVDQEGYPLAWRDRVTGASVAKRWAPGALRADGFDRDTTEGAAELPYEIANLKVEWAPFDMPPAIPIGWWRGVGPTHNLFTVESFIDELAAAAKKDPLEYRRHLMSRNSRALGVLNLAAEKMGWGTPTRPRTGRGVAVGSVFGSYIALIVEAEVTPLGEIRMHRAVCAVDCGIVVNPNTVEAQTQGGLVFGWTGALYSQLTYENGTVQQNNFNDYRMMRMNETPSIEVYIVPSGENPGGIGELGTAIAAPALANAVFAATGVRLRKLPIDRGRLVSDPHAAEEKVSQLAPSSASNAGLRLAAIPAYWSGANPVAPGHEVGP